MSSPMVLDPVTRRRKREDLADAQPHTTHTEGPSPAKRACQNSTPPGPVALFINRKSKQVLVADRNRLAELSRASGGSPLSFRSLAHARRVLAPPKDLFPRSPEVDAAPRAQVPAASFQAPSPTTSIPIVRGPMRRFKHTHMTAIFSEDHSIRRPFSSSSLPLSPPRAVLSGQQPLCGAATPSPPYSSPVTGPTPHSGGSLTDPPAPPPPPDQRIGGPWNLGFGHMLQMLRMKATSAFGRPNL